MRNLSCNACHIQDYVWIFKYIFEGTIYNTFCENKYWCWLIYHTRYVKGLMKSLQIWWILGGHKQETTMFWYFNSKNTRTFFWTNLNIIQLAPDYLQNWMAWEPQITDSADNPCIGWKLIDLNAYKFSNIFIYSKQLAYIRPTNYNLAYMSK